MDKAGHRFLLKYKVLVHIKLMCHLTATFDILKIKKVLFSKQMKVSNFFWHCVVVTKYFTDVLTFFQFFLLYTGFEFLHLSSAVCKITMLIFLFSLHMSAWLIVAVTTYRFLAVTYPLQASRYCTVYRAKCLSLLLLFIAILYNMHVSWTVEHTVLYFIVKGGYVIRHIS